MSAPVHTRTRWAALVALVVALLLALGALTAPAVAQLPAFTAEATPLVSGVAMQGGTLTAIAGAYSQEPDSLDYQWYADGAPVGTSIPIYRPTAGDLDKAISVQVTAHHAGDPDAVTTSATTTPVLPGGTVTPWGTGVVGLSTVPASLSGKAVVAVAAGTFHSLALTSDGKVTAWGDNSYGQVTVPAGLTGKKVVAVAADENHSLALSSDGEVTAWGSDGSGESTVPDSLTGETVIAISAGLDFSVALTSDGEVMAWGNSANGRVTVPASLTGKSVVAVAASGERTLALTSDGQITAWGVNSHSESTVPDSLDGKTVVSVGAGYAQSLAVTDDGQLTAWGFDSDGQATVPDSLTGKTVVAATGGLFHSLALTDDGQVVAWGKDDKGQVSVPDSLASETVLAIAAASDHSLAIVLPPFAAAGTPVISGVAQQGSTLTVVAGAYTWKTDGFDYQWHADGDPVGTSLPLYRPTAEDLGKVITVTVTAHRSGEDDVVTTSAATAPVVGGGKVVTWGANYLGQTDLPAALDGQTVVAVSAGGNHSLALTDDGRVIAFGRNGYGESDVPSGLADKTVVAIAAGERFSLALTSEGQIVGWGESGNHELDFPEALASKDVIAISAEGYEAMAMTSDGEVYDWGLGHHDDRWEPAPAELADKTVVGIDQGQGSSYALTSDGQVVAWGINPWHESDLFGSLEGQTIIGMDVTIHSIALTSDGQIHTGGVNSAGQNDIPASLADSGAIAVAAGYETSYALTPDRHLVAWGLNNWGQGSVPEFLDDRAVLAVDGGFDHAVALAVAPPEIGAPTITGTAQVGQELTCVAPDDLTGTVSYAWLAGSTVLGEMSTFTPGPDQVGTAVTCRISVPAPGLIDSTAEVDSDVIQPAVAGSYDVTLTGNAIVGKVLRAKVADLPEDATVTWQWFRGSKPVPGATSARYELEAPDYGARMRAVATITQPGYVDATAAKSSAKIGVADLTLDVALERVHAGDMVTITVTNLLPGEKWTLGFGRGTWSVTGKAPQAGGTMTRQVRMTSDLVYLGNRKLVISTSKPARDASAPVVILR